MEKLGVLIDDSGLINVKSRSRIWMQKGMLIKAINSDIREQYIMNVCLRANDVVKWSNEQFYCSKDKIREISLYLFSFLLPVSEDQRIDIFNSSNFKLCLKLKKEDIVYINGASIGYNANVKSKISFIGEVPEFTQGNIIAIIILDVSIISNVRYIF